MGGQRLGSTFYFIERPCQPSAVLEWFRQLEGRPEEFETDRGYTLHFRDFGPVQENDDGSVDIRRSPLVSVYPARESHGALLTVGEVHFLVAPSRTIPRYHAVLTAFRRWLRKHDTVFEQLPKPPGDFAYYLEGSIQNIAPTIYSFPSGLDELRNGRYFIAEGDAHGDLSALQQKLRLRGIECF